MTRDPVRMGEALRSIPDPLKNGCSPRLCFDIGYWYCLLLLLVYWIAHLNAYVAHGSWVRTAWVKMLICFQPAPPHPPPTHPSRRCHVTKVWPPCPVRRCTSPKCGPLAPAAAGRKRNRQRWKENWEGHGPGEVPAAENSSPQNYGDGYQNHENLFNSFNSEALFPFRMTEMDIIK